MLYSQGIPLERLGIRPNSEGRPTLEHRPSPYPPPHPYGWAKRRGGEETDPRKVWQVFAENFFLFRARRRGCG